MWGSLRVAPIIIITRPHGSVVLQGTGIKTVISSDVSPPCSAFQFLIPCTIKYWRPGDKSNLVPALEPSTNISCEHLYSIYMYTVVQGMIFVSSYNSFVLLCVSPYQCLGYGENINSFPSSPNVSWTIFLQFPLLSFLDTARRNILLGNIAELAVMGRNDMGFTDLDGFNGSRICVGRYEAYRLSYYEES